jgi:hypothetical protein
MLSGQWIRGYFSRHPKAERTVYARLMGASTSELAGMQFIRLTQAREREREREREL